MCESLSVHQLAILGVLGYQGDTEEPEKNAPSLSLSVLVGTLAKELSACYPSHTHSSGSCLLLLHIWLIIFTGLLSLCN